MSDLSSRTPFVVTGASGYVGSWVVWELLSRGATVRGTVRDPSRNDKCQHLLDMGATLPGQLELVAADLLQPGSFDASVAGAGAVIHTALPFIMGKLKDAYAQLITPAVEGTRNVLRSVNGANTRLPRRLRRHPKSRGPRYRVPRTGAYADRARAAGARPALGARCESMVHATKQSPSSHRPVYKWGMRTLMCVSVALLALGCGDGDGQGAAGMGGDGGLGGMTGTGGAAGQSGAAGVGGDAGAGGDDGVGGDGGAGGNAGAAGVAGSGGEAGDGGEGGSGGEAGAGGEGGSGGEVGTGGTGGFPGNLCPNLFTITPLPRNIPEGSDRTMVETRASDNDEFPMTAVLTLSALWGTFENTENLRCEEFTPTCMQSPNVIFQDATYICSLPGPVELCVEANDGACTKTECTTITCPEGIGVE